MKTHKIKMVVDVRSIPGSRHNPQFGEKNIQHSLQKNKIGYIHIKELGGLRKTTKESKNLGWRNASFRGFADYMGTPEFSLGLKDLEKIAKIEKTVIMCAEAVPWRCHRSLIGDALSKHKWKVFDVMSSKIISKHRMTPFLKVSKGTLTYPKPKEI